MNPRTSHIASLVSEKLSNGSDYFSALSSLSDELCLSVETLDDCYASSITGELPSIPSAEITQEGQEWEEWDDIDVSPVFPWERFNENGSVSLNLLPVVIVVLGLIGHYLT